MFSDCSSLEIIYSPNNLNFEELYPKVEEEQESGEKIIHEISSSNMFLNCKKLLANGTYDYDTCVAKLLKEKLIQPGEGPNYHAAMVHNKDDDGNDNTGLFSAGAVLPNNGTNYESIIQNAIAVQHKDLLYDYGVFQRIESLEFFKCLDNTEYYANDIAPRLITDDPIKMNNASQTEGPIYLYLYATGEE